MRIRIEVTDQERGTNEVIYKALQIANGKASAHTLTSSGDVIALAKRMEAKLYNIVGKKEAMPGAIVTHRSGHRLPNAYQNSRIVTWVTMERGSKFWYLVNIQTGTAWKEAGKTILTLTEAQDAEAIANFRKQYEITRGTN